MNSQDMILDVMRSQGKADALDLRSRGAELDGTAIIAEEAKAPLFDPEKDYSDWPVGAPVAEIVDGGRHLFKLLQPHNAANYPGSTPSITPALWSVCHTTDPTKAKPWLAPSGTSGLYAAGECCTDPSWTDPAAVHRSKVDDNAFSPSAYPDNWEVVT